MPYPRRVRWLDGKYANVDGIPFEMPVGTSDAPALFAAFSIDPRRAQEMLPGQELHPCRIGRRGLLVIAVVNYLHTTIGPYVEFCIGILCTRGPSAAPPILPLLLQPLFGTGVYIYDLPVSSEISVKGGVGIWGMAKRRANLDFIVGERSVSSQYDLDGELLMRIDVPRTAPMLPLRLTNVGYGDYRGMLTKSYNYLRGRAGVSLFNGDTALLVGDHPRAKVLKGLDIDPRPIFTGFVPSLAGVLDDHLEMWFLTADAPPGPPDRGMLEAAEMGLSREWLPPPDRARSDRLIRELSPSARVGARAAKRGNDAAHR